MMTVAPALSVACLGFAVVSTAFGQLFFKLRYVRARKIYFLVALGFFGAVPLFSYLALLNLPVSVVYMSASAANVLILMLSSRILCENITHQHKFAAGLIVAGIVVFNL